MKRWQRWISFSAVFSLGVAGLVLSQTRKPEAQVAPSALFYVVADTERELTRLPMKYTEIPDADEIKIGDHIAEEIASGQPLNSESDENRAIEAYVQSVGKRLASNAHRKLPYKFHYIPEPYFVNAFAIPGGHVYMGAGLLALMENEDELAAVLGHEIEHIDHRHCAERLQTEAALRKIPLGQMLSLPVELFQAGYSKDQESEADREGTRLAVLSGYSPDGAVQLFTTFQKMEEEIEGKRKASPEDEISEVAVQILTGYFRSHPPSIDRAAQIRELIRQEKWTPGPVTPLAVRYIFLGHKAEDLVAAGRYDKALEAAGTALQLHPGYPPALIAQGKASCAKQDFAKAAAAYKELLDQRRSEADSIRAFADERASAALNARRFEDAGKFASFSLQLQPDNPHSLKLLAEVKLETNDVATALEIGHKLQELYPTSGEELLETVNRIGREAFESRNYNRAALFAGYSTGLSRAIEPDMQVELARSQFMLADFAASAESYRKLIDADIGDEVGLLPALLSGYADALGSTSRRADAAREFQAAVRPAKGVTAEMAARTHIEEAGLRVMANDDSMARPLAEGQGSFAPELSARLAWWYYRAGRYDEAVGVLHHFLSQRPGDAGLQTTLGWVQLEQNNPAEAVHRFEIYLSDASERVAVQAGQAIARWRLGQKDQAMAQYEQLSKAGPEWNNLTWVRAIYGPVAAESMQEMSVEEQRRIEARKLLVRKR